MPRESWRRAPSPRRRPRGTCRCPAAGAPSPPFEGGDEVLGKRLEERRRDLEAPDKTDGPPGPPRLREGSQLRRGHVAPADHDGLALRHAVQQRRKLGLCLVNVDLL